MRQSSWRSVPCLKMCSVSEDMACVSYPIHIKGVRLLIGYCYAIFWSCTILNLLMLYVMLNLSLASRSYVHFCIPWILGDLSNYP